MIIRFWGARGSIPVSGKEFLKYGGDTTCVEIRTKNDEIIIIDAGSGMRRLGNKLIADKRHEYNMIFTHGHWDHVLGFPFFSPLFYPETHIKMFGCSFGQSSLRDMVSWVMAPPNFPVKYDDVRAKITYWESCDTGFVIDSVHVIPISLSHPNYGVGYKFVEGEKSFVFLTDNELTFKHPGGLDYQDYVSFSSGVDLLVHDAMYTEEEYEYTRQWGHTVYKDALKLALDSNAKKFGLFHHTQDRTDKALDLLVQDCNDIIKVRNLSLECFAVYQDQQIKL